jgi:hypothetical protein
MSTEKKKKKKLEDDMGLEEINFEALETQILELYPDILLEFEGKARKIKKEEQN